jgi:uroporphyrinogen-III decarboxylase
MGHAVYQAGGVDFKSEVSALYTDVDEALKWDPWELYGGVDEEKAIVRFDQHYQNEVDLNGDLVSMTGIYCTLISGLIEVFGWDMLLSMAGNDPEGFETVTNRYADWMLQYFKALAKSKAPVVRVHDDMVWTSGAFMNPDWYRKFIFPNYKKLWAPLHEADKKIVYTCDGNFTQFIDDVVAVGVNAFMMEPTTDMAYIAGKYGKTHAFVGNAETRVLLLGTKDDIRREVKRCMDIGKKCPGFFLAVGNHIPPNTPVDNVLYYYDAYVEMGKR